MNCSAEFDCDTCKTTIIIIWPPTYQFKSVSVENNKIGPTELSYLGFGWIYFSMTAPFTPHTIFFVFSAALIISSSIWFRVTCQLGDKLKHSTVHPASSEHIHSVPQWINVHSPQHIIIVHCIRDSIDNNPIKKIERVRSMHTCVCVCSNLFIWLLHCLFPRFRS